MNFQESVKTQNSFVSKEDSSVTTMDSLLHIAFSGGRSGTDMQDSRLLGQPFSNKQGAKISAI